MKCLLDVDGVLADFVGGACKLHGFDPAGLEQHKGVYYGAEHFGLTDEAFYDPMEEEFWAGLGWTADGKEILELVENFFGGPHNVCLLTAPTKNHGCPRGKMMWVEEHLPQYRGRVLVGRAKAFIASPQLVLIDDKPENVQEFMDAGGPAVLVPRPWNDQHAVQDVVGHVRKELQKIYDKHPEWHIPWPPYGRVSFPKQLGRSDK